MRSSLAQTENESRQLSISVGIFYSLFLIPQMHSLFQAAQLFVLYVTDMPTLIQKRIAWGYGALVCQSFPLVNVSFEVAQKTETNCLEIVPGNYRLLSCAIHQIGLKYDGTKE